jgi:hypothetical protein
VHPLREGHDPMIRGGSMWTFVIDRPFTPARRAKIRAARDEARAWSTMLMQDDDPTTLDRLDAIMSDSPRTCARCSGQAYVCRAIGCDPEAAPMVERTSRD